MNPAAEHFLKGKSPVLDILRPFAAGEVDWETTRDALVAKDDWAADPRPEPGELRTGTWIADHEPGTDNVLPGTWREVERAYGLGVLTVEQLLEVSRLVDERADARVAARGETPTP